jgi:hypothetical protein
MSVFKTECLYYKRVARFPLWYLVHTGTAVRPTYYTHPEDPTGPSERRATEGIMQPLLPAPQNNVECVVRKSPLEESFLFRRNFIESKT